MELDKRGWDPVDLARASGVSKSSVSDVLNEKRPTGANVARQFARALGYPEEVVLRAAGVMSPGCPDDEREELIHIALYKLGKHRVRPPSGWPAGPGRGASMWDKWDK
jgi:transcriptional regulator with XRE-family HTH domain